MPPIPPQPTLHLTQSEDGINEKQQSSYPPLSQSRARRLKQKTTTMTNMEPIEMPTPTVPGAHELKEQETSAINSSFISKIRENDTLARYKRDLSSPGPANPNDGNFIDRSQYS